MSLVKRPFDRLPRRTFVLATVLAATLPLGACANAPSFGNLFGNNDPTNLPDEPAEKLYNEGLALQNRRDWRRAALKFM
ncbi:hypothetical protein, partial [Klebsiella pneumoniae]|uniref:hypothetical protein n=1 Tax=Klebsiella pneumoniae TaxID=573 RepID=UPI001952B36E